jgi:hypothetical protein
MATPFPFKQITLQQFVQPYADKYIGLGSLQGMQNFLSPVSTTVDLADPASSINTLDKYIGKPAYDETTGLPVWASGPLPADTWDGAGAAASGAFTVEPTNNYVGSLGEGVSLTAAAADNFIAGRDAGIALTSGDANIIFGRFAGAAVSTGGFNIIIGQGAGPSGGSGGVSDKLYIGQGAGTGSPLMYGDISAGSKFLNVNGLLSSITGFKCSAIGAFVSTDGPKFQYNNQYGAIIQGQAGSVANWALTTPTGQITLQNRTADGIGIESGGDMVVAGDQVTKNGNPTNIHWESDGPADEKFWYHDAQAGQMNWILDNDLQTNPTTWATLTRTGVVANILNFITDDVQLNGVSLAGGSLPPEATDYTRAGNMQFIDGSTSNVAFGFNVATQVTQSTFETIGPTGSGSDNIWAALDVLPANATAILVNVNCSWVANAAGTVTLRAFAARGDVVGSSNFNTGYVIQNSQAHADAAAETFAIPNQVWIPLDPVTQDFQVFWFSINTIVDGFTFNLAGFATDT